MDEPIIAHFRILIIFETTITSNEVSQAENQNDVGEKLLLKERNCSCLSSKKKAPVNPKPYATVRQRGRFSSAINS